MKRISKTLKPHEEGLTKVLKDTMPGLVQPTSGDTLQNTITSTTTANPTDDRILGGMDQHHRLLIKPDTFNVTVLFQPTLAFLDRIVDVLPAGLESARSSSGVLEEFVLKVYLPQLEEKVLDLFHSAVTGASGSSSLSFLNVDVTMLQVLNRSNLIRYRRTCHRNR